MPYGDGKTTANVGFMKASEVDDIDLDDEVTLLLKGKVKALRGPERRKEHEYEIAPRGKGKPRMREMKIPGSLELEDVSFKVEHSSEWGEATKKMEEDE